MRCAHCWLSIARHARVASVYLAWPSASWSLRASIVWLGIKIKRSGGSREGRAHASLVKALSVVYLVFLHLPDHQKLFVTDSGSVDSSTCASATSGKYLHKLSYICTAFPKSCML